MSSNTVLRFKANSATEPSKCVLAILHLDNLLQYAIKHSFTGEILEFGQLQLDSKSFELDEHVISKTISQPLNAFSKTLLFSGLGNSIIHPKTFVNSNSLSVLSELHYFESNTKVDYYELSTGDAAIIFEKPTLDSGLFKYSHLSAPFLEACHFKQASFTGNTLYFLFLSSEFYLTIFHNKKLLLFNRFEYQSAADVLYYTAATTQQINLSADQTTLYYAGQVDKQSDIIEMLSVYYPHLHSFSPLLPLPSSPDQPIDIPHQFTMLTAAFLCE